jgi:hypothetical protein
MIAGRPSLQRIALQSFPDAGMPRLNRGMVYLGACLIARLQSLAKDKRTAQTKVIQMVLPEAAQSHAQAG